MNNEDKKQGALYKYIDYLYSTNQSYRRIGLAIKIAKEFLASDYPLSRLGYRKYVRDNAAIIDAQTGSKDCLLELLSVCGVGYNRKQGSAGKTKTLDKLSDISERNRKLINEFIYHLGQQSDYSPHTIDVYMFSVKMYFEYANEISVDNYKSFINTLEAKKYSPATIRLRITALERLSEFVGKPIKLKRPKFKRKLDTDNVPTEEEYKRLLDYLSQRKNKDYYFYIKILATTGARVSEFFELKWEDIMKGEVTLRGKGNKYRRFFFSKALQDETKGYVAETGKSGYVAVGRFGRITQRGFCQQMKSIGYKVGIERKKMHPHAFRHFFAKMFLKSNNDIIQLADLMGHGSVDTTRIYLQKSYDEQKKEFNRSVTW